MATLREWLKEEGFDFKDGVIIYQEVKEGATPGWRSGHDCYSPAVITNCHDILDRDFDDSYGGPECPRIFAKDSKAIYFPGQYDGSTWLEKVYIDVQHYLSGKDTPYPGS